MSTYTSNDIAIIGMSMRFPKASTPQAFWNMLINKKTGISHLTGDELNELGISQEKVRSSNFVNAGSVIEHPYDWDASFFGYSPKAASILDPQQRLSLECAWELIEQAGYSPLNIKARTGVYLSVANNNYAHRYRSLASQSDDYIAFTSNDPDFASTRISYHLNLKGPSMTIETACSSSLVAVHMACESLLNHESEMAICGGASILFPQAGYIYDPNLIFSPDGHCRPFDKNAKGTVFGNGIGLILLKRIKDAIDDRDNILAIIKGSAVNNDGKDKNSFYSPSPEGQKKVIREALAVSGIPAESIGYIEAHGTATPIGDPIEIEALAEVFRDFTSEKTFCYIGSVKSNLGHLNKAAGIAGLIKTVLTLQNRTIPATLNFTSPNPEIEFSETPFIVNADVIEWKSGPFPRRAGVSSFGVGGTNAHIVLEESPFLSEPASTQVNYILPVSAKNEEYLSIYKKTLAEYLKKNTALTIQNIAYTLQESRADYSCRDYVICNNKDQFIEWLNGNEINSETNANKEVLKRWKEGSACDWQSLRNNENGLKKELPGHPMKRVFCHIEDYTPQEPAKQNRLLPLIEENISTFRKQMFRTNFSQHEYLIQEHNFILPAAAYLEMITESVQLSGETNKSFGLKDVIWKQAFSLKDHNQRALTVTLHHAGQEIHVNFSSGDESSDRSLAEGTFFQLSDNIVSSELPLFSASESSSILSGNDVYSLFNNSGFRYGEHFRLIDKISRQNNSAIATINFKYNSPDKNNFILDPLLVDAAFQTAVSLLPSFDNSLELFVPYQLKEARFYKLPGERVKIIAQRLTKEQTTTAIEKFNIIVLNDNDETCITFSQLELVQWNRSQSRTKTREIDNEADIRTTEEIEKLLKQVISEELGYELGSFSKDESFETLGLDSVILVNVINKLDKNFPGLPKTLFLEYPNIAEAALYIVDTYKDASKHFSEKAIEEKDQLLNKNTNSYKIQPIQAKVMGSTEEQYQYKQNRDNDIAIIGVHGIYPEAGSLESFWENLKSSKDCIREIPRDRWPIEGFYSPDASRTDTSTTKWGGFIDKIEYFDPLFFKISPKEASFIDPQERLFLESAWCCVENAGYTPQNVCNENRKVGVYAGVMWGHYQLFAMEEYVRGEMVVNTSNYWSIANRVSFTMNFNGPSMAVDTACSSSLSAIHLACQSILSGETDLAIAGGVNLNLHPYKHYILAARKFAATDGRCRSFGEGGSGYVPGEGVGTVLLKPLNKAIQDKDFIHAVIKGSAINHGGKVSGFTVPNSNAQASVIKTAFTNAGIKPSDISYIEAHGTGTSLGDPIEINGLTRAYADNSFKPESCPIGSVKSNIGHLESAAGIASIHKVILQLNHKTLVPSIHNEPVNPYIDFGNSPFRIQKRIEEWKPSVSYSKRLAGISSFGAGGSNAHVVVEEANHYRPEYTETQHLSEHAIILSAQDEPALLTYASRMLEHLNNPGYAGLSLSAFAFTLQTGRVSMEHRLAFTASSLHQVIEKLQSFIEGNRSRVIVSKPDKTAGLPSPAQIAEFLKNNSIKELLHAWSLGANINWTLLYQNNIPGRIPLPYYPFNKRRLWYKNLQPNEPMAKLLGDSGNSKEFTVSSSPSETIVRPTLTAPVKTVPDSGIPLNYFQLSLKEIPLVTNTAKRSSACLLFSQSNEELQAWKKHYTSDIIWIKAGNEFNKDLSGYTLPLQKSNNYALLYNELSAGIQSQEMDIVIHADSLFAPDYNFLIDLFRHIKQLSETFKKQKINILIYWTTADKNEAAYKAAGSFAKVVSKENSRINIKTTEFRNNLSSATRIENLITELNNNAVPGKRESVYLDNRRYEYSVNPMNPISWKEGISIKPGGIYLITGGMGSIGLTTAKLLISKGAQKVILSGRKPLENLTSTQKDILDQSNGKLGYHAADIADPISSQLLISSIVNKYGKLNGVIHSAGIVDDKLLLKKSEESFINVTGPKIKGALNLDRALMEAQPDFVLLYSSVSAVAGQMGQSDYSSANRFLDEFVSYKNSVSPVKYISVNWPYWNEGGMKLATPYIDMMRNSGIDGISDHEGMQALETILKSGHQQVIIFKGNEKGCKGFFNDTHFDFSTASEQSFLINSKEEKPVKAHMASGLLKEEIKGIITSVLSEALGLSPEEIDSTANLEEYGVDSVAIMKVTSELEKLFPELSIALFFECKSINDIVEKINTELSQGTLTYQGNLIHSEITTETLGAIKLPESKTRSGSSVDITTEVRTKITEILSDALGLSPEEIDPFTNMEEYGVDSVAIMKVTSELEKLFPEVSIALFFECKSINDIVSRITEELNNGTLTYSGTLNQPLSSLPNTTSTQATLTNNNYSETLTTKVKTVITDVLSEALGIPANELSTSIPLDEYGVDSVAIMKVTSELEKLFSGISIALFFECKTINDIAEKIKEELTLGNLTYLLNDLQPAVSLNTIDNKPISNPIANEVNVSDEIRYKITDILTEALGLQIEEIDHTVDLEEYGVDSVVIMKVTSELEKLFPELSIALFFECKSINDIVSKINEELKSGTLTYTGFSVVSNSEQATQYKKQTVKKPYYAAGTVSHQGVITKVPVTLDGTSEEVSDHVINGQVIFAGAGYLDLVKKISDNTLNEKINTFRNISWFAPLIIEGEAVPIEIDFADKGDFRQYTFKSGVKPLAKGEVKAESIASLSLAPVTELISRATGRITGKEIYQWFGNNKFQYGPAFSTIEELYVSGGQVTGRLKQYHTSETWLSPMLLDGIFQCVAGFSINSSSTSGEIWVPFFIEKLSIHSEAMPSEIWVRVEKDNFTKDASLQQFNIFLIDQNGRVYLDIKNFTLKSFTSKKDKARNAKESESAIHISDTVNPSADKASYAFSPTNSPEPIAVIAASCKFPGADSPQEFWKNLVEEKDVVKEIPIDRWDYRNSFDPEKGKKGKTYSKWGGFINNIGAFDNEFFRIKENDAMCLDPQQRILLELTQHLFDQAGYTKAELANRNIAVITGGASGMWGQLIEDMDGDLKRNVVVNTIQNMIAARISDFYDLKGTSLTIDTACSSSLVAVHEACQKIRAGECEMAIAGGITLLLADGGHIGFSQAEVLSPEGKCNVFDKNANGIVLGEGAGIVLLKSYKKALQDGDQILSVIRGSAVNNDGKTMGITTPNMLMQKEVIKMALDYSGVDRKSITYLEAHGTGTLLGDPIEVKAAGQIYGEGNTQKQYCAISSVKANIGHLLHASGIASLIKVSMSLKHKIIPASLNCKNPHPRFEFENSPFYPVTATKSWETTSQPRRAAISSFGFGGTNCHMILEETNPSYVPTRKPLPLTKFKKKRFWPGCQIELLSEAEQDTPLYDQTTVKNIMGYSEILEKLEKGLITVEEAIQFEKSLK